MVSKWNPPGAALVIIALTHTPCSVPLPSAQAAPPAVAGAAWLAAPKASESTAAAEILLGELNCLSCHAASEAIRARVPTKPAPDLENVGARIAPSYLERFLADPQALKPGATMPNIFHASENASSDPVIDYLTHFLVARGGVMKLSHKPVDGSLVAAGEHLYHTVGCVACHPPQNGDPAPKPTVPLGRLAEKIGVDPLTEFLLDPLSARPAARMPNPGLSAGEARAIAVYLLREQIGNPQLLKPNQPTRPGLAYEFFQEATADADFKKQRPDAAGEVSGLSTGVKELDSGPAGSVVVYHARLSVFDAGKRRFRIRGTAGSALSVNEIPVARILSNSASGEGEALMDAGSARLSLIQVGAKPLTLEWLDMNGDWAPVPSERITIPNELVMMPIRWRGITLDPQKVKLGRQMFSALRCAACHQLDEIKPMITAKPLERLKVYSIVGCTGEHVKQGVPKYEFSEQQRETLKSLIRGKSALTSTLRVEEQAKRSLATFNCYGCHSRDELGGPDKAGMAFFHSRLAVDVGDEGRLPPSLDGVGAKLKPAALRDIIVNGQLHVRPYLKTRMPRFGTNAVSRLIGDLISADEKPETKPEPQFTHDSASSGLTLAGVKGLGCVTCHDHNTTPGIAVQGIDFTRMNARLNFDWFERFLRAPASVKPGTRMPAFWPDGQSALPNIEGGDATRQVSALWNYLSAGADAPPPVRQ